MKAFKLLTTLFISSTLIACGGSSDSQDEDDLKNPPAPAPEDTINLAPIANGGEDKIIVIGKSIMLDGSLSSDPELSELSFGWAIDSHPAGSEVALNNADAAIANFTADQQGEYVFKLTVDDADLIDTQTVLLSAYYSLDDQSQTISDQLHAFDGDEIASEPITYTQPNEPTGKFTLLGGVFCEPEIKAAAPVIPVIPVIAPNTQYGCENSLTITAKFNRDMSEVSFTVDALKLYIDLDGFYMIGNAMTLVEAYYLIDNVKLVTTIAVFEQSDGSYTYLERSPATATSLDYLSADLTTTDENVNVRSAGFHSVIDKAIIDYVDVFIDNTIIGQAFIDVSAAEPVQL